MSLKSSRQKLGRAIVDMKTPRGQLMDITLYALNFLFVGLYVASTYNFSEQTIYRIHIAEISLAIIFLCEYLLRIDYAEDTLAEMLNLYTMADLIAILPVFLLFTPFPFQTGFLRALSVLRVFRFLRYSIDNETYLTAPFSRAGVLRAQLLTTISLIFFLTAGFFHAAEVDLNPNIDNFGDALYFAIIALTTVGFGDIVPVTTLGRLVISIAIIAAVITIPWQASRVVRTWNTVPTETAVSTDPCPHCESTNHALDAVYCKYCGTHLSLNPEKTDSIKPNLNQVTDRDGAQND